jgi:threonine dehydrogenase-like Zn-dependent dehydrogenase
MWTSTLDLDLKRTLLTRLFGRFWSGAYFSSFAPLRVHQTPRQPLAASNWVRVRNRLAGINGRDLQLLTANGDLRVALATLPQYKHLYPGQEVVGEVIEVGDDVQRLRVGDRVALQYTANCLASGLQNLCRSCAEGCYNLCENSSLPAPTQIGGGWSEEMLIAEQQLALIPDSLSDEQAVFLLPTAIAVHAVPHPGERVLIVGAGTIGLLTLQVIRALAPQAEISVLARHPFQVEQATRMGAAHIIYPQDSYVGIQRVTHAQIYRGIPGNQMLIGGYDVIFDTVGKRKTLHHALRWAHMRAAVVLVGIDLHLMNIDLTPLWYQELNLLGSRAHGLENWPLNSREQAQSFDVAIELIEQGYVHPEFLITHHYALTNYQNAILTSLTKAQSRAIKVVFDYSLLPASVVPNVRASARRRRPVLPDGQADRQAPEDLQTQNENDQRDTADTEDEYITSQTRSADTQQELAQNPTYQPPLASELTFSDEPEEDEEYVNTDPHSSPTLREEEFVQHQPQYEPQIELKKQYEPQHQPQIELKKQREPQLESRKQREPQHHSYSSQQDWDLTPGDDYTIYNENYSDNQISDEEPSTTAEDTGSSSFSSPSQKEKTSYSQGRNNARQNKKQGRR